MKPLLELKGVSYSYHSTQGATEALVDINFQVMEGEFVSIVGPSGCGKTTLLSLISGLLRPESGTVCVAGRNEKNEGTNIGYMLQKDHLFEWRTVYSNVILGLEIQNKLTMENKKNIDKMLDTYGLNQFRNARPSQLSGGMRQRAALIRTLALEPDLLLLDEPFSALDYQTRLSVGDDIGKIIKKEKKTAILVTHDLSEAISLGERVIVLSRRPATVKTIIETKFDMDERTPLKVRNAPEFKDYFNQIWKELNEDG